MDSCDGAAGVQGSLSHPGTDFVGAVDTVNFSKLSKDAFMIMNVKENGVGHNNLGLRKQDPAAELLSSKLANFEVDITVRLGSDGCSEQVSHKFPAILLGCCPESANWLKASDAVLPGFVSALRNAAQEAEGYLGGIEPALRDLLDGRRSLQEALESFGRVCTKANALRLSDLCVFDIKVTVDDKTHGIDQPLSIRRNGFRVGDCGDCVYWGSSELASLHKAASENPFQKRRRPPFAVSLIATHKNGIILWSNNRVRTNEIVRGFDNLRELQCWLEEIAGRFSVPMLAEWSKMLAISVEQHMVEVAAYKRYRTCVVRRIRREMRKAMANHNHNSAAKR